ncbi:MAG: hypothetical protein H6636_04655 [Anaerolineales bacterium]|nr:hypothetical protein [Anaerolineales bacterium]
MRIEVILDDPDFDGLGKCGRQGLHKQGVFLFCAASMDLGQAIASQRLNGG